MSTEQKNHGRATREQLEELHGLLADQFLDWMTQPDKYRIKPFHLNVVRQFLKDNGCTKALGKAKDIKQSLEELRDAGIPFLPDLKPH